MSDKEQTDPESHLTPLPPPTAPVERRTAPRRDPPALGSFSVPEPSDGENKELDGIRRTKSITSTNSGSSQRFTGAKLKHRVNGVLRHFLVHTWDVETLPADRAVHCLRMLVDSMMDFAARDSAIATQPSSLSGSCVSAIPIVESHLVPPEGESLPTRSLTKHPPSTLNQYNLSNTSIHGFCIATVRDRPATVRAVKFVPLPDPISGNNSDPEEEAYKLKQFRHRHIVRLHEIIRCPRDYAFVMDYCDGGPLFEPFENFSPDADPEDGYTCKPVEPKKIRKWLEQLSSALRYMHRHNVYHCDLKPDNVLIDNKNEDVTLIDFGISTFRGVLTGGGHALYCAPELLRGAVEACEAIDFWSVGIMLFMMMYGRHPFSDNNRDMMISNIKEWAGGPATEWLPPYEDTALVKIVAGLLIADPKERKGLMDLKERMEWVEIRRPTAAEKRGAITPAAESLQPIASESPMSLTPRGEEVLPPQRSTPVATFCAGTLSRSVSPAGQSQQTQTTPSSPILLDANRSNSDVEQQHRRRKSQSSTRKSSSSSGSGRRSSDDPVQSQRHVDQSEEDQMTSPPFS